MHAVGTVIRDKVNSNFVNNARQGTQDKAHNQCPQSMPTIIVASPCSNEYFLSLSYPVFAFLYPFLYEFMRISNSFIKHLADILHHPQCPEFHICFNPSLTLRQISSPFRRGAPRAYGPELTLAHSSQKVQQYRSFLQF
jgi:hypothetical protein